MSTEQKNWAEAMGFDRMPNHIVGMRVSEAHEKLGGLDIMVNNPVMLAGGQYMN